MNQEIIAIMINKVVYTGGEAIMMAVSCRNYDQLISRKVCEMMAMMDLGPKWLELANNAPTLFWLDSDNNPVELGESFVKREEQSNV